MNPLVGAQQALERLKEIELYLGQTRDRFEAQEESEPRASRAREWFLDNDFLVLRTVRQVRRDMPVGFYGELLHDGGPGSEPRVARLARELLLRTGLRLDEEAVREGVRREQQQRPLATAELWALPALLRLAAVAALVSTLREVFPDEACPLPAAPDALAALDPGERVGSCMRTFRVLNAIDWKTFFRSVSALEQVLQGDPSQAYGRMDFATQDHYRQAVERMAKATRRDELDVARLAVECAHGHAHQSGAEAHVGHYLVGDGREAFERRIGYRPRGAERLRRRLTRRPAVTLLDGIGATTLLALTVPAWYLATHGAGPLEWALGLALTVLPASTLGVTVVHWLLTHVLPPRVLPKLDLTRGIPADCATVVIVPCLLGSAEEVRSLVRQLELHFLRNSDPQLRFALLSDHVDAAAESVPEDLGLLEQAETGIRLLNLKYGQDGQGPFHLLHRRRLWNSSEGAWMGWERKRGKLQELNVLLLGREQETSFARHLGDPDGLKGIRYVITLDAGTLLPRGAAARLIGTLAHPLNRAEPDPTTGIVTRGYGVLQPRVEIAPMDSGLSRFTRLFAGDGAIDIYTRAVSDVYQDLSGEGIYIGKGIYDLAVFEASLEGRVPENALVSHDHFEGLHARVALVTDIVLFEDYPPQYLAYARRLHRWIRGDWQLLPWLRLRVRGASGRRHANPIHVLGRWILFDNLRRSLVTPGLLLMLAAGWLVLPGAAWFWTMIALLAPAGHLFTGVVSGLILGPRRSRVRDRFSRLTRGLREGAGRWLLYLVFMAHEALVATDAIVRTLLRLGWTRRGFLEWRTADHTAKLLAQRGPRAAAWSEMAPGVALALLLGGSVALLRPSALTAALPLLVLWCAAPEIARFISRPIEPALEPVSADERARLRRLARRTWFFYESFVGPDDQWLPPDNFQEHPRGEVAHRTSPTNIGMLLNSTVVAYDLGYLGPNELAFRLRNTLETIHRMKHVHGHLLNWYDTRTLNPLEPRYVSTVDSGNLAATLLVVEQACAEVAAGGAILDARRWQGLLDNVDLLETVLRRMLGQDPNPAAEKLFARIQRFRTAVAGALERSDLGAGIVAALSGTEWHAVDQQLLVVRAERKQTSDSSAMHEVRLWIQRVHQHLRSMARELDLLAPWIAVLGRARDLGPFLSGSPRHGTAWSELERALGLPTHIGGVAELASVAEPLLTAFEQSIDPVAPGSEQERAARKLVDDLRRGLTEGRSYAAHLQQELLSIGVAAEDEVRGMDFGRLYDPTTHLMHIGYNVSTGALDANHYDLLASEARIASFLAIAKGDVPTKHWFFLGRPLARVQAGTALLSWGATQFEYLMPALWMQGGHRTLLGMGLRVALETQIEYGRRHDVPWGISESGFYAFDGHHNYQYRSFGVPGLGLRRGLEDDLVVSPYSSLLALNERPATVLRNLQRLVELGGAGTYGLYEAIDFTPERLPSGCTYAVVQSYMAHHQGMVLAALGNFFTDHALVRRFHASSMVQTADLLLHEQMQPEAVRELPPRSTGAAPLLPQVQRIQLESWSPDDDAPCPEVHLLSNGRLHTRITSAGAGGLTWNGLAITRWSAAGDPGEDGYWIYLRDEHDGQVWSVTDQPVRTAAEERRIVFHPERVEFQRRDRQILTRTQVFVAPRDDVEIRLVTLVNESGRSRRISLTSCAEAVLAAADEDVRHPAFSKLFVETEVLQDGPCLLAARRERGAPAQPVVLLHRVVGEAQGCTVGALQADREVFLGRWGSYAAPAALDPERSAPDVARHTLDAIFSARATLELEPFSTHRLAFVTVVAGSREAALETASRYASLTSIDWALQDAEAECRRELQVAHLEPRLLPWIQRLTTRVVHPQRGLRAPSALVEANTLGKPRLWGHGVSGDLPIVLLKLDDPFAPLLVELLDAHAVWRRRGLPVELVLLLAGASSYGSQDAGRVWQAITEHGSTEWLNRRGGLFVVQRDQIGDEERTLLEVSARVVLDARGGQLEQQLSGLPLEDERPAPLLSSRPPLAAAETPRIEHLSGLEFENGFGGFSQDGHEYVIDLEPGATTPAPWCNVLANPEFGCMTSEAGLGYTWSKNASQRRLTPWHNDPVRDQPAEALYLRDEETGEVWSPTPLPAGRLSACRIHHGAGYTDFHRASHGIDQRLRVWVPRDQPLKVLEIELENRLDRTLRLTATYYVELVLGERRGEGTATIAQSVDTDAGVLLAHNPWNPDFAEGTVFMASSEPVHGFTLDRAEFLGRGGDAALPEALLRWGLSSHTQLDVEPCQALMVHTVLEPGERRTLRFFFGEGEGRAHALELVALARQPFVLRQRWDELQAFWQRHLGAIEVRTPDRALDLMLNRWLPYQSLSSRIEARTGFYQSSGAYGFRDQLQDVLGLLHAAPERTREQLLIAAAHQFEQGDVLHWWHDPSGAGVKTRCSDDLLWLPYVAARYVQATGDLAVLDEPVPFLAAEPLGEQEQERYTVFEHGSSASLFEHCRRAIEYATTRGIHGLPLIGAGDWNDGMSRVGVEGRGESVWLAWFLIATLRDFAAVAERYEQPAVATTWRERAAQLQIDTEASAWTGEWYLRAWYDDGTTLGGGAADRPAIDLIAQAWAAISGAGSPERVERALAAATERLVRPDEGLVLLLAPPFGPPRSGSEAGYIQAYPPGVRENGGQYTHAAAWLGWANVARGDGDAATRVLQLLNPIQHSDTASKARHYRTEPYVIAADVYGAQPHVGRGGWTWYTGSASWTWRLGVEGLLGLRRESGDLRLQPCIPRHWEFYEMIVRERDCELHVRVDNPDGVTEGVAEMLLDGRPITGDRVPLASLAGRHELRVRLGSPDVAHEPNPTPMS